MKDCDKGLIPEAALRVIGNILDTVDVDPEDDSFQARLVELIAEMVNKDTNGGQVVLGAMLTFPESFKVAGDNIVFGMDGETATASPR